MWHKMWKDSNRRSQEVLRTPVTLGQKLLLITIVTVAGLMAVLWSASTFILHYEVINADRQNAISDIELARSAYEADLKNLSMFDNDWATSNRQFQIYRRS